MTGDPQPNGFGDADAAGRWVMVMLMVAALLAVVFLSLPTGGMPQTLVIVVAAFTASGLVALRLARERLLASRPWLFLLVGPGLYAVATSLRGLLPIITGRDLPFPSWLDGIYFASYVLSTAFLVSLIHLRHRHSVEAVRAEAVALLDVGIFVLATIAVLWPYVIEPTLADPGIVGMAKAVALGYPLLTAVLVGLAARLAVSAKEWTPVLTLLLIWAGGELAGDIVYGYLSASGAFHNGHPVSLAWLVSYAALGALALHPGLLRLTEGEGSMALHGMRLWLPLGAVLVPLGVALVAQDQVLDVLASLGVVLVIVRLKLMSGDLVEQRRLAVELAALTQRFEHQSLHDPLTGLANRSLFGSQMEQAWSHHKRHGRGLVVIVLDLDDFKMINDRHGHHVGDQVLVEVARRTQTCVRDSDTVARLGGDEFAIILPEADLADAQVVADRVRRELARPIAIAGEPHRAAASIGIARATEEQQTAGDLLREADAAMYVDKAANRERD